MSYTNVAYVHIQFVIEFIILAVCPVPFFEAWVKGQYLLRGTKDALGVSITHQHFISDYFLVVMFLRLIFLFRSLFNYSMYRDEYSKKICRQHGIQSGVRFTFKCLLDQHP